ncbi:helix-turn-helix domain-containing protein [Paenibacillus urinalis]|uniref:Helix-turn-helix domain-containing protein n=1 Tax=Paenibacillus urinalis TaxID=521520 RepID=A0AAX3MTU7_9BACL|nr:MULTISPECIES: helix-turn-helix domain-containing protein [Paenibacillus]WDH80990.1 helix-turn-helix domain-containing protein [Paenibacillus urinalis]WDH97042.1 helix-turn-helix domain-containing protein [Paenibacillus urinalis]WDI00704.1 helix-turn-helix domain-containing protein [Paenibacillus urinalis]GAK39375.1 hypothetical protein TCA2_1863 [Paenibacillus sp. TCA20]
MTDNRFSAVQSELIVILEAIPPESMRLYVDRYLGRLEDAVIGDPDLLLTLETYVSCQGQISELASKLFIHRNTAAYRLMKLERLLNMQLKSTDSLLLLHLVFMFRSILEIRGKEVSLPEVNLSASHYKLSRKV